MTLAVEALHDLVVSILVTHEEGASDWAAVRVRPVRPKGKYNSKIVMSVRQLWPHALRQLSKYALKLIYFNPAGGRVGRVTDCGVRGLWFKSLSR